MRIEACHFALVLSLVTAPVAAQTITTNSQTTSSLTASAYAAADDQGAETHPPPAHTGWSTLAKDTAQDFVAFPKRRSTWVLLGVGAAGALAAHPADDYVRTHIVGSETAHDVFKLGKVLGSTYVQTATGVGLWLTGRYLYAPAADEPQTNKLSHLGFDLIRAQIVSQTIVHAMKYSIRRDRPTGECCAFPSGHAATAFATAAVLERHFGYRGSWPALVGAAYVAASRLVDNRHFLSDVIFGAAVGEATGWTIVGRHGRNEYALQPVPVPRGMMVSLVRINQ
jgi:membrane-associated phospholipid phosphatase